MLKLSGGSWFVIAGRGRVYAATLPHKIQNRSELIGCLAEIEGGLYRVKGVELFMHMPPWREGEQAGFLVEPVDKTLLDPAQPLE